ncbi:type IV secretory system conjugative DNA transfer family protein [uncultured Pseudokineococcus sp.]|uniref:type IV secretory system conjugative DNA transfer family protein n=1 Tax=uncultured Pseudokineococcus sp. TaxID=1642928 RepID=UPI0026210799|nr:TraM recognition domain-containing protein [uncultured Pseudokineococcus sp.]
MSAPSRRASGTTDDSGVLLLGAVSAVIALLGALWAVLHLAAIVEGAPAPPANPFDLVFGLIGGEVAWTTTATVLAVAAGVVLLLLATAGALLVARRRAQRARVDAAAAHMGRGRDIDGLRAPAATATSKRLGVATDAPGLPLARTVAGGALLYTGWEDVAVDIWGPRTGKTTSRAIPAILDAPGAVIATSNKRDLVDATRDPRAAFAAAATGDLAGGRVWVFDPQGIVDEAPSWWWNPLSYVTDEVKASQLADIFAAASRDPGARTDAYFDGAGRDLLANLLLAAAVAGRPLTDVYLWLSDTEDDEPVSLLRAAGYPLSAAAVSGVINSADKQRAGVYGTAQQIASFMTNRAAMAWVTPPTNTTIGANRSVGTNGGTSAAGWVGERGEQFDPAAFVRTAGTLYSLSKEGRGSAGPLVTALTVAVTEAAEDLAKTLPGGRLATPMVAVLDEAANVCRWRELPNLYSHYGSRGIVIMTILQSWSQGVDVWGREGMRKLWSAANIKVYGGGVSEVEFLTELSALIGEYERTATSTSSSRHGRSTSRSATREKVLDVADLAALSRGRAVVLASGSRPTLVRTLPWMTGPHAEAVTASIKAHDPAAARKIAQASTDATQAPAQAQVGA